MSFNYNDSGYYWCQIIANDVHLQPSLHVYVTLTEGLTINHHPCNGNHGGQTPICAENATYPFSSDGMTCSSPINTTIAAATSHDSATIATRSSDTTIIMLTEALEDKSWVYGIISTVILLVIVTAVMGSAIVCYRVGKHQDKSL